MAKIFQKVNKNFEQGNGLFQKRDVFRKQIRRKDIDQIIKQMRVMGNEAPHIKSMVNALPQSHQQLVNYMVEKPGYEQAICKMIIDRVYQEELSEINLKNKEESRLISVNPPSGVKQLSLTIFFFITLLRYQGIYSPQIFKRYFLILFEQAKVFNVIYLMFCLINQVIKKSELNWIPEEQIRLILKVLDQEDSQSNRNIHPIQIQCHVNLVLNYYTYVENSIEIKTRIKFILQKGSTDLLSGKAKEFFKLCLILTVKQCPTQENNQKIQQNQKSVNPFFQTAMINGRIIQNIYRQIFFSKNQKLRLLCMKILSNLIIQFGSLFMWKTQKISPIERFDKEIKDDSNSQAIFKGLSEIFLISILQLPPNSLSLILQNEIDTFDLIFYILEHCSNLSKQQEQILRLAEDSLWYMLKYGQKQLKYKLASLLIKSEWKNLIGSESELVDESQTVLCISVQ